LRIDMALSLLPKTQAEKDGCGDRSYRWEK
jgi:hypothetical protein